MDRQRRPASARRLILWIAAAVLVAVAVGALALGGSGGERSPQERVEEVASGLRCPTCQGLSVQDSTSPMAVSMKQIIEEQVADGRTDEEIRAYFVDRYSDWVLLSPPAASGGWLIWVAPALVLLGGLFVVLTRAGAVRMPRGAGWLAVVVGTGLVLVLALQANSGDRQAGGLPTGSIPDAGSPPAEPSGEGVREGAGGDELAELEARVQESPESEEARLALAAEAFTLGRPDIVRDQTETILDGDPNHLDALMLRALVSTGPEDTAGRSAATRYLELAPEDHPGEPAVRGLVDEWDRIEGDDR